MCVLKQRLLFQVSLQRLKRPLKERGKLDVISNEDNAIHFLFDFQCGLIVLDLFCTIWLGSSHLILQIVDLMVIWVRWVRWVRLDSPCGSLPTRMFCYSKYIVFRVCVVVDSTSDSKYINFLMLTVHASWACFISNEAKVWSVGTPHRTGTSWLLCQVMDPSR